MHDLRCLVSRLLVAVSLLCLGLVSQAWAQGSETVIAGINSGGGAVGAFSGDNLYNGGTTATTPGAPLITTTDKTPSGVYSTYRVAASSNDTFYEIMTGLDPNTRYTLRCYFCEPMYSQPGIRLITVAANNNQIVGNHDTCVSGGGYLVGHFVDSVATSDANGHFLIQVTAGAGATSPPFLSGVAAIVPSSSGGGGGGVTDPNGFGTLGGSTWLQAVLKTSFGSAPFGTDAGKTWLTAILKDVLGSGNLTLNYGTNEYQDHPDAGTGSVLNNGTTIAPPVDSHHLPVPHIGYQAPGGALPTSGGGGGLLGFLRGLLTTALQLYVLYQQSINGGIQFGTASGSDWFSSLQQGMNGGVQFGTTPGTSWLTASLADDGSPCASAPVVPTFANADPDPTGGVGLPLVTSTGSPRSIDVIPGFPIPLPAANPCAPGQQKDNWLTQLLRQAFVPSPANVNALKTTLHTFVYWGPVQLVADTQRLWTTPALSSSLSLSLNVPQVNPHNGVWGDSGMRVPLTFTAFTQTPQWATVRAIMGAAVIIAFIMGVAKMYQPKPVL